MITTMKQNASFLVGIVADDLTSATDGAAPFLAKGYAPLICLNADGLEQRAVVSISTNSRNSDLSQAARATADAISALSNARFLIKTIDSTLRGHIRAEVAAAFRASGRSRLVIAPAFPAAGRLTVRGIQTVNGVPVSDSDYGRDPVHPAVTSHIADLIDPSLGRPVILAGSGSDDPVTDAAVLILDAVSQDELNRQVGRVSDPEAVLWVGSPRIAIALASLIPTGTDEGPVTGVTEERVLIVAGSQNPLTHAQCDTLTAQGVPVVTNITDVPANAPILCLRAPTQRQQNPARVLADLTEQAALALRQHRYDAIIATGGETMSALVDRLGVNRFVLTGEIEPGFSVGKGERTDGAPLTLAMKAGGFGSLSTLLLAVGALSGDALTKGPGR
jgi:uncharacterized protein YgbK (DUF1537 family)